MARNDFNGDGRSDVLWHSSTGRVTNWLGQSNGGFIGNFANADSQAGTDWHIMGTGDFNGDGRDDVLWRKDDGSVTDWLGQANGGFVSNFANAFGQVDNSWQIVGTGDFNGDGRDDVLWRSNTGRVTNWLGQTNGGFVGNFANADSQAGVDWHIVGVGDFDGDGRDDVLWRNDDGSVTDWLGQSNGGFASNFANAFGQVDNSWQIEGVGDFNGDGRDDVLWHSITGRVTNWLGQANGGFVGNFVNSDGQVGTDWHVVETGDYNGDGRDDVLWRNDDGSVTDWLGQPNGGFASNFANAFGQVDNSWDIQPQFTDSGPHTVNLNRIQGGSGADLLIGTAGGDTIIGGNGNDIIFGMGGNDQLFGDQGQDTVHGGDGNDVIYGSQSADNDILYGDLGADTFHFDTFTSAQVQGYVPSTSATIMDFQTGLDTIDLRLYGISTNDQSLYWLGNGNFTGANRLEARYTAGVLEIDYNGDRIPELILNIDDVVAPSDFTYTPDPWGY